MAEFINSETDFSSRICSFYYNLKPAFVMPEGVEILQPYAREEVRQVVTSYYKRYYSDTSRRIYLLGINPGRFGGGVTGIPFTDPVQLTKLQIPNQFLQKAEL